MSSSLVSQIGRSDAAALRIDTPTAAEMTAATTPSTSTGTTLTGSARRMASLAWTAALLATISSSSSSIFVSAIPPPSSSSPLSDSSAYYMFPDRGGAGKAKSKESGNWHVRIDSASTLPSKIASGALPAFSGRDTRVQRTTPPQDDVHSAYVEPVEEILINPTTTPSINLAAQEGVAGAVGGATTDEEDTAVDAQEEPAAPRSLFQKVNVAFTSPKFQNFQARLGPAVFMIIALYTYSSKFKEDGLIWLASAIQVGLYSETSHTIGGDNMNKLNQWWWFITYAYATNAPRLLPWATVGIAIRTYGMVLLGIVGNIFKLNLNKANTDDFREWIRETVVAAISLVLTVAPAAYWIALLEEYGMAYVYLGGALIAINDTMAYVFGMTMGRHPLLPTISAKKTWEGFIGAAFSTMGAGYALLKWTPLMNVIDLSPMEGVALSLFASTVAPFGGFLASTIKRAYNKKDFGTILGKGHGGLVDRLDCQLVMAPFLYMFLQFVQVPTSYE